ncbi:MAG TPA: prepilin peptidase [Bryobacteraceae bacterium]|nr:prepilin peptidase [Bryobacteraceae bacterium]
MAGLLIGSFLNVCVYRWPRDLSVMRPSRSYCPGCNQTIAWYDNIPVLSWLLLRARCRHCGTGISWRYPLVELLTGLSFAIAVHSLGLTLLALKLCLFSTIQIALFFSDLEERILPDEFTKGGIVAGVALAWFVPMPAGFLQIFLPEDLDARYISVIESAASAALLSFVLWGIGELYFRIRGREGLGLGDVKMVGMLGAFLGLSGALFTLIVGSVLGSLVGIVFIYLARKDAATYELPSGSFLALAALLVGMQLYVLDGSQSGRFISP